MLSIENLTRPGLEPASLTLQSSECVALGDPLGAGKALLLRTISNFDANE